MRTIDRLFQDDLPEIRASRLRSSGAITAETCTTTVEVAGQEFAIQLALRTFGNGGNWSLIICPSCGRRVKVVRVLDGRLACRTCCLAQRVWPRAWTLSHRQRAEASVVRLTKKLSEPQTLRKHLWGSMERRKRHEAALREAQFRAAQRGMRKARTQAIDDPCNEPDFTPPRSPAKPSASAKD